MEEKTAESAVLSLIADSSITLTPYEVRCTLELKGIPGCQVRNAIARLHDGGSLHLDTDMKLHII